MGAGRKTQTFILNERTPSSSATINAGVAARHLRKSDLGGVIFGCKHNTMKECLSKQLFGLPAPHFAYVRNVDSGLPLFLFNYSDRTLHGIFEAACTGQMNINPYGWTEDGSERTPYPAQVRIHIQTQCQPLSEKQFRPIISDNFYSPVHFWFELDHAQVENLISLFTSRPFTGSAVCPRSTSKRNCLLNTLPSGKRQPVARVNSDRNITDTDGPEKDSRPFVGWAQENQFETLPWDDAGNDECGSSGRTSSSSHEDGDFNQRLSELDPCDLDQANMDFVSSSANPGLNGGSQTLEAHSGKEAVENDVNVVLSKLKKLVVDRERLNMVPTPKNCPDDIVAGPIVMGSIQQDDEHFPGELSDSVVCEKIFSVSSDPHPDIAQVIQDDEHFPGELSDSVVCEKILSVSSDPHPDIAQLREGMRELKNIALEQLQWTKALETKLVESNVEIQQLKERVKELESLALINESPNDSVNTLIVDHEGPIYLLGGYDGSMWLSTLDSYSPSKDILTSLRPMSSTRSYAATTALNNDIYILGGGNGRSWYDTVERYSLNENEWMACPRLIRRKGSLAGATLQSKIFAIGGGDGMECFADVEMLDLALGRWIDITSMHQKRFAPAAAELNGVLYAVGGYDGKDYLKSAERFDPREASWVKLPSMDTRRGCHSLVVFNEKLYAIGGYDGTKMVSSIEVFDPRTSSWVMGSPLNHSRGYGAAAVLGDSIFLIGGVKDGERVVDAVECHKEGTGWQVTSSKAIGKRCFFSAVVL